MPRAMRAAKFQSYSCETLFQYSYRRPPLRFLSKTYDQIILFRAASADGLPLLMHDGGRRKACHNHINDHGPAGDNGPAQAHRPSRVALALQSGRDSSWDPALTDLTSRAESWITRFCEAGGAIIYEILLPNTSAEGSCIDFWGRTT